MARQGWVKLIPRRVIHYQEWLLFETSDQIPISIHIVAFLGLSCTFSPRYGQTDRQTICSVNVDPCLKGKDSWIKVIWWTRTQGRSYDRVLQPSLCHNMLSPILTGFLHLKVTWDDLAGLIQQVWAETDIVIPKRLEKISKKVKMRREVLRLGGFLRALAQDMECCRKF